MQNNKNIFFGLAVLAVVGAVGGGVYVARFNNNGAQDKIVQETPPTLPAAGTATPPFTMMRAPDGSMVPVYNLNTEVPPPDAEGVVIAQPLLILDPNRIPGSNGNMPAVFSAGTGTTTMKKETPFNDILIAESGSPYASLRNARYTIWPYPGEVALKEAYIILPDMYDPIFPGYSDKQFIESMDGTKHVIIYLRHKQSTGVGSDARIFVQSPITTDQQDHPLALFESTSKENYFSIVANGKEVIVEVSFTIPPNISPELFALARKELLRAVENMEIIW